jgi:hypothetical protein
MNKNHLIPLQLVLIVYFNSVTMESPGVSVLPPALFTFENLPEHKLGSQHLNCLAVRRERNYTEEMLAHCLHCSWCLLLG